MVFYVGALLQHLPLYGHHIKKVIHGSIVDFYGLGLERVYQFIIYGMKIVIGLTILYCVQKLYLNIYLIFFCYNHRNMADFLCTYRFRMFF